MVVAPKDKAVGITETVRRVSGPPFLCRQTTEYRLIYARLHADM